MVRAAVVLCGLHAINRQFLEVVYTGGLFVGFTWTKLPVTRVVKPSLQGCRNKAGEAKSWIDTPKTMRWRCCRVAMQGGCA
jgi:hypothetical protein